MAYVLQGLFEVGCVVAHPCHSAGVCGLPGSVKQRRVVLGFVQQSPDKWSEGRPPVQVYSKICTLGSSGGGVHGGFRRPLSVFLLSLSLSLLSPFSTPSFSFIFRTRPRHLFSLYMQPFIGYWALQGWTPKAMGQHLPYRVLPPVSFAPLSPHPGAIALAAGIWGLGSLGRGVIFRDGRAKF